MASADNPKTRGRLKVFLGYAAGVGKTYQMLTEAQTMKRQGHDIVVAWFEPHGRKDTIRQTEGLEFMPRRVIEHRGSVFEEMDTVAVLHRHPQIAVVDEFAHANVPGAEHPKRWQDVMLIRDAGIDVLTSLNIQHIESLNDQVWHVTGIRVRETIPDWVVNQADEVVMVDVTPRALLHRLERGVVYSPDKARKALENFFTESNLTALRELALRQTAHQIETHQMEGRREELRLPEPVRTRHSGLDERILLWITPDPSSAMLIRRGQRVADYLSAPCEAIYLDRDAPRMEQHLNFCRNLRSPARAGPATRPAEAVAAYARQMNATQIYVARTTREAGDLVRLVKDMQVTIVSERTRC
jgi:two-component system sensor histidine kinase KdpD